MSASMKFIATLVSNPQNMYLIEIRARGNQIQ